MRWNCAFLRAFLGYRTVRSKLWLPRLEGIAETAEEFWTAHLVYEVNAYEADGMLTDLL